MDMEKEVYTTFEVAKICNANITSIKNWIDQGELRAFRTPGGHYRIERKVLNAFLNRHGMPNPFAERSRRRILLVHQDEKLLGRLREAFGEDYDYDLAGDAVDALLKMGQWKPDAAVIDYEMEGLDVAGLCARVREHEDLRPIEVIVIHDEGQEVDELLAKSEARTIGRDDGADAIVEALRLALA